MHKFVFCGVVIRWFHQNVVQLNVARIEKWTWSDCLFSHLVCLNTVIVTPFNVCCYYFCRFSFLFAFNQSACEAFIFLCFRFLFLCIFSSLLIWFLLIYLFKSLDCFIDVVSMCIVQNACNLVHIYTNFLLCFLFLFSFVSFALIYFVVLVWCDVW